MNSKVKIIVLGMILCLSSCSLYYKFKFKTSKPRDERTEKQVKYLLKHDLDTSYMFNLRDSSADVFYTTKYPLFTHDTVARPFQVRTFDRIGDPQYNWSICYGYIDGFFNNGTIFNPRLTNVSKKLDLKTLAALSDNPAYFNSLIDEGHDLYIVSFWAMYFGTPMVETMQKLEHFADTSSMDVIHIKCNLGKWL